MKLKLLALALTVLLIVTTFSACEHSHTLTGNETRLSEPQEVSRSTESVSEAESSLQSESEAESQPVGSLDLTQFKAHSTDIFIYNFQTDKLTEFTADNNSRIYPASTTKLLTALFALELMDEDEIVHPGDEVFMTGENASFAYVRPQHSLKVSTLIEGMLLPSGNDAAYALAAAAGRKLAGDSSLYYETAIERFVQGMNEYATKIGCTDSHFTKPDGFDGDENYSCLADMALISKRAAENEVIMRYAGLHSDDVTYASGHTITWVNTNKQLDPESEYYNEHVIGLKTGSLNENCCVITLYDDGEHRFIIGVFGAKNDDDRYKDTQSLIKLMTQK